MTRKQGKQVKAKAPNTVAASEGGKAKESKGFVQKMKDMLNSGISPETLALSFACGMAGGIFPIPGLTTFPVLFLVWVLKLQAAASMLINYCMTPANLATVIPFIRLGERLMQAEAVELDNLMAELSADVMAAGSKFGFSLVRGIVGWTVALPFIIGALYFPLLVVLRFFSPLSAAMEKRKRSE